MKLTLALAKRTLILSIEPTPEPQPPQSSNHLTTQTSVATRRSGKVRTGFRGEPK